MTATAAEVLVQEIPIALLVPSEHNPRKTMDAAQLSELAGSIQAQGVQVPLLVRPWIDQPANDPPYYEIIAGHRRHKAAEIVGLMKLPCIVREISDDEAYEIMVVENLQRADLPPLEEADAYQGLLELVGSLQVVAARVGKPIEYVTRRLKLRTLTSLSRRALSEQLIAIDHAMLLCKLAAKEQDDVLKWTLDHSAGVKTGCEKVLDEVLKRREERKDYWGYWEPQSVLELKRHIEQTTDLALAKAPWDLNDAELVPSAGSCRDCEKNTKANTALFGDLVVEEACCTDGKCFDAKRQAFVQIQLDAVKAAGKDALLLSWKYSATPPPGVNNSKFPLPGTIFKAGQWVEAKPKSCAFIKPGVTVDFESDGSRGYMGSGKERKPGEALQVCIARGCKAHPKSSENVERSASRNENSEENRAKREKQAAAAKAENAIRAELVKKAIAKVDKLSGEILRNIILLALPNWLDDAYEATFPGLEDGLKKFKVDSPEFAKAAVSLLFVSDSIGAASAFINEWNKPEEGRREFLALLKTLGVDGSSAWAKPKVAGKPEGKEVAENRQSQSVGASSKKRSASAAGAAAKPAAKAKAKPAKKAAKGGKR